MEYLPYVVLGVLGGVLADRVDRRRVLVIGDLMSGAVTVLLAVIVTTGVRQLWAIYAVAFLLACVDPLYQPAFRSMVPRWSRWSGCRRRTRGSTSASTR
ncbi:hypothetical protein E1294_00395 [Nonomuraea diastatica]|uniref:MFS transporter n=1 Tax=Nonomuraea diastatica TaxID=1848329 RepID=A0A4R4X7Q5_9ACTN|nr:hypothetical protein E1294_00395 [Nonomuraea diastatica]